MKKNIVYITAICLTMACLILSTNDAISHPQQDQSIDTASHETDKPTPYVTGITAARARSLVGGVMGLLSLVIGLRAKTIYKGNLKRGRLWLNGALVLGLLAIVLSVVHLFGATGGFGSGSGKAGAIVALVLGVIGTLITVLALYSKRK